ncbi:MAG TPA: GlsB/YeaQ/YmgE family stress response membrane protein [Candidatus Dormibacteraeota bacterium]|nr:GlsB/YeaQ/YmgE family stress response membrane protein [Candidatus Dormibacteraeota bacterium]
MTITVPGWSSLGSTDTLVFLVVGLLAGALARRAVAGRGHGLLVDLIVGVIGAFLGPHLLALAGIGLGSGPIPEAIVAFIGAAALLLVVNALSGGLQRR